MIDLLLPERLRYGAISASVGVSLSEAIVLKAHGSLADSMDLRLDTHIAACESLTTLSALGSAIAVSTPMMVTTIMISRSENPSRLRLPRTDG